MENKKNAGFTWLCHHDVLLEWCYDYKGRVRFIWAYKPPNEVPIRLQWFQFVKGKLPVEVIKARRASEKAVKAQDKAWVVYDKEACVEALESCNKAMESYNKAVAAYRTALKKHKPAIEKLHAEECSGCPWNGKKLVFEKG